MFPKAVDMVNMSVREYSVKHLAILRYILEFISICLFCIATEHYSAVGISTWKFTLANICVKNIFL